MRALLVSILLGVAGMTTADCAFADKAATYTPALSNLAVNGHDPVAYFTDGKPVQGKKDFEHKYNGATWRFASAESLAAFKANPEKYAPQYGGYCAWAVSQGYTASADPKNWRIVDGKLYLNYNDTIQARWEKDIPGLIAKANGNWPKVLK
jgi:YHS domain-containing protein